MDDRDILIVAKYLETTPWEVEQHPEWVARTLKILEDEWNRRFDRRREVGQPGEVIMWEPEPDPSIPEPTKEEDQRFRHIRFRQDIERRTFEGKPLLSEP